MKAISYSAYAGIDGMALNETPRPVVADDEVLVQICAAGVNPVDIAVSEGVLSAMMPLAFPIIAGSEMAGIVAECGSAVQDFSVGDAVHGTTGISGSFADYVAVKASALMPKPECMSFEEAAGLPIAASTVAAAFAASKVGQGTRVAIHAASGGVGTIAVQIAKALGAHVVALASPANLDFVRSLGADEVCDRTGNLDQIRDMDVVLDGHGPEAQTRSWAMLRRGGILASLVTQPSPDEAERHGVTALRIFGTPTREALAAADRLAEEGKLRVIINQCFPLDHAVDALRVVAGGGVRGKNIVVP
jgi:NADPH:quinone reductase-like Zn-dependent oxidoreductase